MTTAPARTRPGFPSRLAAEWFGLRRRPGVLVLSAIWGAQVVVFAYLVLYIVYRSTGDELPAADARRLLGPLLPASTDSFVVGSLPLYGGPVMLAIGALIGSGDYRFGTLRTLLSRYPNRTGFLTARLTGLLLVMLAVSVLTMLLSLVASAVIASIEARPLDFPGSGALLLALGSIWLIASAWAAVGFMLGTLTRSVLSAIAAGIGWTLGVETLLIGGLSGVVPALDAVRSVLLSANSGSLASALGAAGGASGTPGVVSVTPGPVAAVVLACFVAVAWFVALTTFRHRDIH